MKILLIGVLVHQINSWTVTRISRWSGIAATPRDIHVRIIASVFHMNLACLLVKPLKSIVRAALSSLPVEADR